MANDFEKLDFSTLEGQKTFENYPEGMRNAVIDVAREEAEKIKQMVLSGEAKNYDEALRGLPEVIQHDGFKVLIDKDNNFYLDFGGGETFIGNPLTDAMEEIPASDAPHGFAESGYSKVISINMSVYDENMRKIFAAIDALVGKPGGSS